MDLRIQVPGLSYFSIDLVLELLRHTLWGFLGQFCEEGYEEVPKSDRRPVWRRRRFFISSIKDSVLERRAALEFPCFGIGFGRLELNFNYTFVILLC